MARAASKLRLSREVNLARSIVKDVGYDTVAKRKVCTLLLRQRGFSYRIVGKALGVSDTCAYGYAHPDLRNAYYRHTTLGVVVDGKLTLLTGLNKRKYTRHCELCGKHVRKRIYYHHWLEDFPNIGLWLCGRCRMFAEVLDDSMEYPEMYRNLKLAASLEVLNRPIEERIDVPTGT